MIPSFHKDQPPKTSGSQNHIANKWSPFSRIATIRYRLNGGRVAGLNLLGAGESTSGRHISGDGDDEYVSLNARELPYADAPGSMVGE
jgi:hypothetical protein